MKKIIVFIIAAALALSFFGCAKSKSYDANELADALNLGLEFGEALEKSDAEVAYSIYAIDPELCTDAALYLGSGATADEIAVFNCKDKESVEMVVAAANDRLNYLHEGYSSYGPAEVPKIDAANVITEGLTVVVCICENPDAVSEIIK